MLARSRGAVFELKPEGDQGQTVSSPANLKHQRIAAQALCDVIEWLGFRDDENDDKELENYVIAMLGEHERLFERRTY